MMVEILPLARRFSLTCALLCAAQGTLAQADEADEADEPAATSQDVAPAKPREPLPALELSEPILYQYLLAETALQRGQPDLAARSFLDLARRTRDPRLARRAMEVASGAQLSDVAIDAARIWLAADPTSTGALQSVTALLISARRVEEAEPFLEQLIASRNGNAAGAFMQLGRLFAGNPDKAANLRVVRQLAKSYPRLPQAHFAVAQAARAANDDAAALEAIRQAALLQPDWDVAALFEAELLRADAPDQAVKRLADYVAAYPDRKDVRLSYARLLARMRRYAEARSEYEKLLAANPKDTEILYSVGLLAHQIKDYDTAERCMRRLLELGYRDANAVRYVLGQIAEEQKKWSPAIEWYERVERGEYFLAARLRAAQATGKQRGLDEARAYIKRIPVADDREQAQLIVAEAQLLRDANRSDEALAFLAQALGKQPDQPDLLYDYALTAEKLQRYDAVEAKLRKLIELEPNHAHAYNALGYSFAERNTRLGEARKLIEKALEISPDDYFIIDSMGWVLYREGDLKGAVDWLRRAYSGRADGEIGAHLGEVLWVGGQRDEARRIWNDALKSYPDNDLLLQTVKRFEK
jgi:tetratricopeptide (TPR) repeat protein